MMGYTDNWQRQSQDMAKKIAGQIFLDISAVSTSANISLLKVVVALVVIILISRFLPKSSLSSSRATKGQESQSIENVNGSRPKAKEVSRNTSRESIMAYCKLTWVVTRMKLALWKYHK
jgi:hypothetical protein